MIYLSLYETVSLKRCVMKLKFLLLGTSLSFIPLAVNAQCVATQDCATLGYTETSCNGGKGVKCPFGNKWACLGANEEEVRNKLCQELGFTLTCTGTGYAGGAGSACGGKYTQCSCASGYEWKDGSCQKQVQNGAVGDLYYCNGVVVGVKTSDMDFFVAMNDLGRMYWSSGNSACQSYSFCGNLKGTLPTKDQLVTMYNNKSTLEALLTVYNGNKFSMDYYWSSIYYNLGSGYNGYYVVDMSDGGSSYGGGYDYFVRPVLVNY